MCLLCSILCEVRTNIYFYSQIEASYLEGILYLFCLVRVFLIIVKWARTGIDASNETNRIQEMASKKLMSMLYYHVCCITSNGVGGLTRIDSVLNSSRTDESRIFRIVLYSMV